jgi:hypothetical protein
MAFLQAQYAPSMYIGLWSRLEGFGRSALTEALEDRQVVQGTLLRATIHLVSAGDWWPAAVAVRQERRRWWLGAHKSPPSALAEVESAAEQVRRLLSAGPQKRAVIAQELDVDMSVWNGVNLWVDMVRVPPSGTWEQRRADRYALAEDWLGPPPPDVTEEGGRKLLLQRYLGAFGPASLRDAANWAGLPPAAFEPVAARMGLRRFTDEKGSELLDLPDAPVADPGATAPVRFLPTFDATLLAHARRSQILREEHRPLLFSTKSPQSTPSFLVDGQVAGTWRYEQGRIELKPFGRIPRRVRAELDEEAERLAAFHA